jgi:hypothetical protein
MVKDKLSRREFIKIAALGMSSISMSSKLKLGNLPDFPTSDRLGRICVGSVELKASPDPDSATVGILYEDAVLPWIKETVGWKPFYIFSNQRWVETPEGYIYGPYLQPVYNKPNQVVGDLPATSLGKGMWAEVTVPYVDAFLDKDPSSNSWVKFKLEDGLPLRLYYSQVFWVDQIKTDDQGKRLYRVNPNYYGGVDLLWAAGEAFRPLAKDDLEPVHPEALDKHIEVNVNRQSLSCYEGNSEVFFCRVATGAKFDMNGNIVDKWETPVGSHQVTRKYVSLQMSGGTTGAGYDLPGIGWSSIFATGGVAIHSTFWHNNFGNPVSHGCVNCNPEDAKWIFRWSLPSVVYDPGMLDITVTGEESTSVRVIEG